MKIPLWSLPVGALTGIFLGIYFNKILTPKRPKLQTLIIYDLLRVIVTSSTFYIMALVPYRSFINIGFDLLLVLLLYKGKSSKKLIAFLVAIATLVAVDYVTFFLIQSMPSLDENIKYYISDIIFLTSEYLFLKFLSDYISYLTVLDDKKTFATFILIPVSQVLMLSLFSYTITTKLVKKTPDGVFAFGSNNSFALTIVAVSAISIVADLVFMRIAYKSAISRQERNQLEILEKENQINYAYYSELQTNADEMRKYRHDVNNIIQTIYILMNNPNEQGSEGIQKTLKSLEKEINSIKLKKYCSNNLINSILAVNEKRFTAKGIACDIKAAIPEKVGIPELDMCRLFTNILDNAYNAMCDETEHPQTLTLEAHISDGFLYISESNTCPDIQKPSKPGHGLGLKIIKEIAEKHGGYFKTEETDGYFNIQIAVQEASVSQIKEAVAANV